MYKLENTTKILDTIKEDIFYAIKKDLDQIENRDEMIIQELTLSKKDFNNLGLISVEDFDRLKTFTFVHYGYLATNMNPGYTSFYLTHRGGVVLMPSIINSTTPEFDRYFVNCVNLNNHQNIAKPKRICWICLRNNEKGILSNESLKIIKLLTSNKQQPMKNINIDLFFEIIEGIFEKVKK